MKVNVLLLTLLMSSLTTTEIIFSAEATHPEEKVNPTLGDKIKGDDDDGNKPNPSKLLAQVVEEARQCPICLQTEQDENGILMAAEQANQLLSCKHREFHQTCLTGALARKASCPLCRAPSIALIQVASQHLLNAAIQGNLRLVQALIDAGANINATDAEGRTPLQRATYQGNLPVAQALIDAGADVNAPDEWSVTPLHRAAIQGNLRLVQALIAAGANVNAANEERNTPLHCATIFSHVAVAQALIAAPGINVNAADAYGNTPLHTAAEWGRAPVVQALLDAGADRTITDEDGQTAADIAASPAIRILITQYQPAAADGGAAAAE